MSLRFCALRIMLKKQCMLRSDFFLGIFAQFFDIRDPHAQSWQSLEYFFFFYNSRMIFTIIGGGQVPWLTTLATTPFQTPRSLDAKIHLYFLIKPRDQNASTHFVSDHCSRARPAETSHGLPALSREWQHVKLSDVSLGTRP